MTNLKLGEDKAFVEGRSPETARRLLKAAEDAGLEPSVVRTTTFGYIVPKELGGDDEAKMSARDGEDGANVEAEKVGAKLAEASTPDADTQKLIEAEANNESENPVPQTAVATPEEETKAGEGDAAGDEYDPADHNAEEVNAYLDDADDDERDRVLAAEKSGKARKTVLDYEPKGEK